MSARPVVVLAMLDGLAGSVLRDDQYARLDAAAEVPERRPLPSFDEPGSAELLERAEVLLGHWGCPTLTAAALEKMPRLRLFAYAAGTVKWQVTDAVWERGIVVTSAAAANARPVAEYAVAIIVLANKGVLQFRELLRDPGAPARLDFARVGNAGKRVGLVGASHVGRLVIELLRPYDVEVAVYDPYLDDDAARVLGVERYADLDSLCGDVDVLSVHAPDVEATRGMIGAAQLARLRDGATFVNTARPALVDQDALEAELRSGRINAVLDVATPDPLPADHPLLALPNAFVTPHIAGSLGTELFRMTDLVIGEIERFARGEPPLHPVTRDDMDRIA